jgi:hypothetical protein
MAIQTVPASKIDTEIVVYDVRHLTALATWIESARLVIENIQDSAGSTQRLTACCDSMTSAAGSAGTKRSRTACTASLAP